MTISRNDAIIFSDLIRFRQVLMRIKIAVQHLEIVCSDKV
ncbi:hypothetical protein EVA_14759 [gut metagenome]|uniref:Uncharacterized protein n=1 Tax=gut metagenome TaxID=749906 RepID=J9CB61_9ZZZZ